MKKNRRGLGRGLGALIQSTVPDDDDVESGESSSSEVVGERRTVAADSDPQPEMIEADETTTQDTTPVSATTDEQGPERHSTDPVDAVASAHVEEADATSESIASRYIASDGAPDTKRTDTKQADTNQTVPRGTSRPVDVFFPDRRAEPLSAAGRRETARTGSAINGRKRPSMPALEPRAPRSRHVADPGVIDETNHQPVWTDEAISTTPSPGAATSGPVRTPSEASFSGTTGDAELRSIPVADIHPNPRQPREVFDEDDMDELVASIREVGVLQPIVVRPVDGPSPYELVMGERRWRASQRAGMENIPAIVRHTADTALLRDALLENLHRSQLNPLEEAAAYEQLLEDFECTQDELSNRIGRSRPQISNTLRLLKLPPLVQRRVASGVLSAGHARALLGLVDPGEMEKLAQKIVSEGLSVRATEELVSLHDGIRQAKPKSRPSRTDRHERLDYLATSLTDQLDTTVKITLGARKGKIAIDFASVEDLNRIMDLINPSGANDPQA